MSVDKLVDSAQLDANLTSIANIIRTKSGNSDQLSFPNGFINEISNAVDYFDENADFCFWDYDGTPLYSYTTAQLQALTELPPAPDHSHDDIPLTFLYWNWTLEDLKAFNGAMDVGACYKPTDGKMHWFYKLTNTTGLTCSFTTTYTNDVVINWGDGTGDEHWGTSTTNGADPTHTYAAPGLYHCTWSGSGRPSSQLRTENNSCVVGKFVVGDGMTGAWLSTYWKNTLNGAKIEIIVTNDKPTNYTDMVSPIVGDCNDLKFYVFNPYTKGSNNLQYWFRNAYALKGICCNNKTIQYGEYFGSGAGQLKRIRVSPNFTHQRFAFLATYGIEFYIAYALNYRDFQNAYGLKRLVIKCNSIDSDALGSTIKLQEIWCGLTTPPTLGATTPFSGIVSWAKIHVPASALNDYKNATNWSTYADYMVGDWVADPVK